MCDDTKMTIKENDDLEKLMSKAAEGINEKTELGEVTKEFSENKPSASNLSSDEMRLVWRGQNILKHMSPKSAQIITEFIDLKRSVKGWNTDKKVEAIAGAQNQRSGNGIMQKLFSPKV
jgi:hypothetical protein